ncbi:MAG: hypothetical protein FWH07_02305, partial [Oscillospiraceae bacterium]|nr:hypothetical protein [Oscillospiraceae bacterium]
MNSNITIAPNIYVRSSAIVQNDDEFVKRVYGHRALNILKTRFAKTYASRFTRAQIEEMKQNVICRHGKTREYAYGKALLPDGKVVWSCRCEHTDCHAYDSCMSLPNALRIVREGGGEAVTSKLLNPDEFDGKSIDDDVFEPPHVSIVLERLNEILTWNELDSDVNSPLEKAGESMPAECQGLNPNPENKSAIAEKFIGCRDKRVLVVCKNSYEAGYLSTILYKNKVRHRLQRLEGYTLSRKIADVFWDYCEETIDREVFFNRGLVRLGGIADYGDFDKELEKFYDALFRLCGDSGIGESGGLRVSQLADALNESPELISECVLNMDDYDFPVTVATLGQFNAEDDYDAVYALVGETP